MYTGTSTAFNEKVIELSRTFRVKIECGSKVIDEGFKDVTIHYQAHANEETISIGDAVAAYVTINMYKPDFTFTGKTFTLFVGLTLDDGSVEYVQMGIFTAQKPETDHGMITFTAYDCMTTTLGHAYFSSLEGTTPMFGSKEKVTDIKNVLQEIIDLSGITFVGMNDLPDGKMVTLKYLSFNDDETVIELKKTFDGDYTYREVIGYIAGCYGKFATINAQGQLEFRWYKDSGYTISKQRNCDDVVLSESKFTVKYLAVTISENNVLKTGSGTTGLNAYNPFMPDVESIKDGIIGMSYYPMTISYLGDPRIQIGDIVKIEQDDGTLLSVPVMSLTQDYDGGLTSIVGCYGNTEEADVAAGSIPDTTMALDSIKQQLLQVQEVNATTVTTEYLNANYATIQSLTAVTAEITDLKAHTVTTDYLEANYANITLANIDKASVGTLLADVGLITDAKIENGHVTGYLDSVLINATNIKAGTLSVDRLVINGSDDSIIYALNNAGQLTSTHCDTLDGGLITERTITCDHLVAGTITSNEINTSQLFASSGFISALSATSIIVTTKQTAEDAASVAAQAKSTANSASSTASSAVSTANSAASAAAEANSTISKWAYTGTTKINGGAIQTDTIEAGAIKVSDLTAFGATIGGWTITNAKICAGDATTGVAVMQRPSLSTSHVFAAGGTSHDNYSDCPFRVTKDGKLYSTSGQIGGFAIGSTYLANGTTSLAGAANSVYLGTNGISCGTDFKVTKAGTLTAEKATINGTFTCDGLIYMLNAASNKFKIIDTTRGDGIITYYTNFYSSKGNSAGTGSVLMRFAYCTEFSTPEYIEIFKPTTFSKNVYFADGTDYYINSSGTARVASLICKGDAAVNSLSVTTTATLAGNVTLANGKDIYVKTPSAKSIPAVATSTSSEYLYLGGNSYVTVLRGSTVYLKSTSTTVTSDRNQKNSIEDLDARYEGFFLRLSPKRFKYNDGSSGRYHNGFIAQDVYDNLIDSGLTDMDFAGYVNIDKSGELGLMYDDFISINTHMIQKNYLHLSEHDQKIHDLQTRLADAEATIKQLKQAVA